MTGALAEVHGRRYRERPMRTYPYETKAVLGKREQLKPVTVLAAPRTLYYTVRGYPHPLRLVKVLVRGEDTPYEIAVMRLEEEP